MKKTLVLLGLLALSAPAMGQSAPLPGGDSGNGSSSIQLRAPSPDGRGPRDLCCQQWKKSTCAKKEDGKCVEWNYTCARWGKPPCRMR